MNINYFINSFFSTQSKEVASSPPVAHSKGPAMAAGDHDDRLTQEQVTKLHKDVEVVQANMAVLNEMLTTLIPGQEHSSDIELLTVSNFKVIDSGTVSRK